MHPHMWPVRLYSIFPHYPTNSTIKKRVLICLRSFSETSVITSRIERDIITNMYISSCEVPGYSRQTLMKFEFDRQISRNIYTSKFMKIHPVGAELFHKGELTDDRADMMKLTVIFRNFMSDSKVLREAVFLFSFEH
jgi:hypothetical protein